MSLNERLPSGGGGCPHLSTGFGVLSTECPQVSTTVHINYGRIMGVSILIMGGVLKFGTNLRFL